MMARWMDPETGRFISPDPAQQGINYYIYSGNNPTTMIDPSGLAYWDYYGYGWGTESGYSLREQSLGGQGFYGGNLNNNFDFSSSYSSGLVNFGSYQQNMAQYENKVVRDNDVYKGIDMPWGFDNRVGRFDIAGPWTHIQTGNKYLDYPVTGLAMLGNSLGLAANIFSNVSQETVYGTLNAVGYLTEKADELLFNLTGGGFDDWTAVMTMVDAGTTSYAWESLKFLTTYAKNATLAKFFATSGDDIANVSSKISKYSNDIDNAAEFNLQKYSNVDEIAKATNKLRNWDNLALSATKNPNSNIVVLGKTFEDNISYTKVASNYKATYFKLNNWGELSNTYGMNEMWKINRAFIDQQIKAGKQIILSHDPAIASGFFRREINYLTDLGYKFIQDGWIWRAMKK